MSVSKHLLVTAVGLAMVVSTACGEGEPHPGVVLGTYQFDGSMDMMVSNCTISNPTVAWKTTFRAQASEEFDRIWIAEEAFGCEFLVSLKGSIADGGGLSCPVSAAGFFRQDFFRFRWDFAKKELSYSSVLYGQDANSAIVKFCASVRGSIATQ